MSRYATRNDVAAKVDYEGGFASALDYGLTMNDMPEGDYELMNAWQVMEICWGTFVKARERVRNLLPEKYEDQI